MEKEPPHWLTFTSQLGFFQGAEKTYLNCTVRRFQVVSSESAQHLAELDQTLLDVQALVLYTGRGPSSGSMHLGQIPSFIQDGRCMIQQGQHRQNPFLCRSSSPGGPEFFSDSVPSRLRWIF
jgi:hypothetical protein